jgi:ubiquinone/menaquinone biosynthesis C-methylase UbiE
MKPMELKQQVRSHWEQEVCGTRFAVSSDRQRFFEEISRARYTQERYIPDFADFEAYRQKRVLEIGVGAGSDFERWVQAGASATGTDLTEAAIALTRERLHLHGVPDGAYRLSVSDAERLEFADGSFDLVYSLGVLHHTPDTPAALREVWRVLAPGGEAKLMVYGVPSWTGLMLWVRHALLRGRLFASQRRVIYERLESPGTKAYSNAEFTALLRGIGFADISCRRELTAGDLLAMPPSQRYAGAGYRLVWRLYPRWLIRRVGRPLGLALVVHARKPVPVASLS